MAEAVVIAGLYGVNHSVRIPGMGRNGQYANAPLWTLNDWHGSLCAKYYQPERIFNVHNDLQRVYADLGVDFFSTVTNPYTWAHESNGVDIVLSEPCPFLPFASVYPYKAVREFLKVGDWFFSSSMCYMMGLAAYEGYDNVVLRNCALAADDEHRWQTVGVSYAVEHLVAMGISVDAPLRGWWLERIKDGEFDMLKAQTCTPYHARTKAEHEAAAEAAGGWTNGSAIV